MRVMKTRLKLEPLAGIGVAQPGHEEAEAEGQHEDVQHGVLLCNTIRGASPMAFTLLLSAEVPSGA